MYEGLQQKEPFPLPRSVSMESVLHDPDSEWKTQLQLRLNGPVHRNRGITADEVTKKKNVEKLKHALYQSYNQQEGLLYLFQ